MKEFTIGVLVSASFIATIMYFIYRQIDRMIRSIATDG